MLLVIFDISLESIRICDDLIKANLRNHILLALSIAEYLIYGVFMLGPFVTYTIELLPERGYTLIMVSHWLFAYASNVPYYYLKPIAPVTYSVGVIFVVIMSNHRLYFL